MVCSVNRMVWLRSGSLDKIPPMKIRKQVPQTVSPIQRWLILAVVAMMGYFGLASFSAESQAAYGLQAYRYPNDDLGAVYGHEITTLKVWAPGAESVKVILF